MFARRSPARAAAAALSLSSALLAACGGSDDPPPPVPVDTLWVVPDAAAALDATERTAFAGGGLYLNAHTAANAGGEIRGQLDLGGTVKLASLDGAQETPAPVDTAAFGAGVLQVDEVTGAVRGFVVTSGVVSPTVAHVHQGARGAGGGPIITLVSAGRRDLWVVPDAAAVLTGEQITAFQAGDLYFNVHTAANGGGEIRGQLDKVGAVRVATLDGAQERPTAVTTSAYGAGLVAVDGTTGQVSGFLVSRGLVSPTVAHVHQGARGASGGPIVDLARP
jgi:hypothetical protein